MRWKRCVARCYYADRKRSGDNDRGAHRPAAPDALVFGLLIAFSNTILAYSLHAYQSELYPTRIRARAVGFTYSWSRFSTIFVGFFVALFLRHYGTTGVFLFIAGVEAPVSGRQSAPQPRTGGNAEEACHSRELHSGAAGICLGFISGTFYRANPGH